MKRYLIILFWICLTISVSAQIEKSPHMFFSNVLLHEYAGLSDGSLFSENTRGWGIEAGYMYQKDNLRFALPIRTSVYKITDEFVKTSSAAADLQLHYLFGVDPFRPYIGAGVSVNREFDVGTHIQVPIIAGVNYYVNDVAAINFQVQYRLGLEDDRNNLQIGLGFVRHFSATGEKQMLEEVETMDVDGDGITDDLDLCPNVPGLATFNGCPDKDGDGIPDYKDKCPEFPGLMEMGGCPDSDGDGLSDNEDNCPKLPGLKEDKGCPKSDMDNDGVADNFDRCPRVAGSISTQGCPDTDKDGIANIDDKCPSLYGPAETNGCPDSDNDGVDDSKDLCPKSYGPASNRGCPEITKEDKELLAFAVENVEFEHNSSYLTVDSKPILDEVANIMRRYPDYNLMISGHTDNTGSTMYNQEMSEKRARTCYLYLMEKGILQNKLSYAGYGETKPIGDNETLMGRSKNRRVEFELYPGGSR